MAKEKVNYQEVYDLYQLCSEVKELKEFCSEMGVNYDKFMNWQRHQLWDAKLGKTVAKEQPQSAPVKIVGTPSNQSTVKIEPVKPSAPEPIRWVKVQLADGANLFLIYVYHLPANRVRKPLRDQGVHIGKSTLNRYIQNGMRLVREYMEDPFKKEVQMIDYMMVDETTELVGVEEKGKVSYRKKYLWAFFAKLKKMVFYLYDEGSRSRRVALDFLKKFSGYISTDGYTAYSIFDDAVKYPNIVHVGCWVHARRKWIDALPTDRRAMDLINDIADL